jgi:hypothetical protein
MVLLEDTIINSLKRIVVQGGNLFSTNTTPSFILTPICKKNSGKIFGKLGIMFIFVLWKNQL